MSTERWEHTVLEFRIEDYNDKANALAKEGWELVTVMDAANAEYHYAAFFKRRYDEVRSISDRIAAKIDGN